MNYSRLIKRIKLDEGKSLQIYTDTRGNKTIGIGHLITDNDPEYILKLLPGEKITEEQCASLFGSDLAIALRDAIVIFGDQWHLFPDEAQEVFVNMLFNLGRPRFLGFKKMIAAAYEQDWNKVSAEMLDSKWAEQLPRRASRLNTKIESLVLYRHRAKLLGAFFISVPAPDQLQYYI